MEKNEVYYLDYEDSKTIGLEEIFCNGNIQSYPFLLSLKKLMKRKSGDIYKYSWSILIAPKMFIDFVEHEVESIKLKEYEKLWKIAVRKNAKQEYIDLDKKTLEAIQLRIFALQSKLPLC